MMFPRVEKASVINMRSIGSLLSISMYNGSKWGKKAVLKYISLAARMDVLLCVVWGGLKEKHFN